VIFKLKARLYRNWGTKI